MPTTRMTPVASFRSYRSVPLSPTADIIALSPLRGLSAVVHLFLVHCVYAVSAYLMLATDYFVNLLKSATSGFEVIQILLEQRI